MKIYQVGGSVRDELLGYPVKEIDWVVVGAKQQQLLDQGYRQVGKDFPVFLHPVSKQEYALARTERKIDKGYTGFSCDASEHISLEEDLFRRDLTINAMAKDDDGNIVDPHGGQRDLHNKWLRHVSPAFVEDPLRVLRVARFAARYHFLGFRIALETLHLMATMVASGELKYLVPERITTEFEKAMGERNPEVFISVLLQCGALEAIFPEIHALFGVPQNPKYHPEVDSGLHTLMALKEIVKNSNDTATRFAVLCHDLGKATTEPALLPKHHGHEQRSIQQIDNLQQRLHFPNRHVTLAKLVAELHGKIHRARELKPSTVVKILQHADAFRKPNRFLQILQCCEADFAGRFNYANKVYTQKRFFSQALDQTSRISAKPFVEAGLSGEQIKNAIQKARLDGIKTLQQQFSWD